MCNSIFKAILGLCVLVNTYACHANEKSDTGNSEKVIEEFNAWSSTLENGYSYDSIKNIVENQDEYLIVAKLRTHPVAVEALIVLNDEYSNFLYLSSENNRLVSCSSVDNKLNLDIASDERLSEIEDVVVEIHPYYTVVEKSKNEVNSLFTFSSYYNAQLRKEVDGLESYLLRSMLNTCPIIRTE